MADSPENLAERTYRFARDVRRIVNLMPSSTATREDIKQVVRSSGSVAANYLEAQEGLSRNDFFYRIKVCRKEARESQLWLKLLAEDSDPSTRPEIAHLMDEANQLTRIFASIAHKQDDSDA
ncbi:four helix bundle protein [Synoicihabitans lomoniglobus]|uniref:Four helix bundle protein n=1 Tax=Synoicihabitans lomoniglobus TaxID=2909285 RepID=A0AAF0CQM5_9BACT|nr:four helix bundle protein [Opitutaceae bacterium LMO-M01]WED66257.1 four helix bundle protein [Opitutaceae bacterium LMO-M01]